MLHHCLLLVSYKRTVALSSVALLSLSPCKHLIHALLLGSGCAAGLAGDVAAQQAKRSVPVVQALGMSFPGMYVCSQSLALTVIC